MPLLDEAYPHRGRLEILVAVLNAARRETKPTRIMYGANLSYVALQKALLLLTAIGLLTERRVGRLRRYEVTPDGEHVLALYQQLQCLLSHKPPRTLTALRSE